MIYDIAIIGGGPAGYSAALESVRFGKKTILFEKSQLGGTCLNKGCIPTKFLGTVSEIIKQTQYSDRFGINYGPVTIDYKRTIAEEERVISTLRNQLRKLMEQSNITIIEGFASIEDVHHVICCHTVYDTNNIIIATGSEAKDVIIDRAITSDDLLKLDHIPQSMAILGGGVVAVEFAHIFNGLGTKVNIVIRGERILRKWDKELAIGLSQNLKKEGIRINTKCILENMKFDNEEIVLSALGRRPVVDIRNEKYYDIGEDGGIVTNSNGKTKTDGIYAVGDVTSNSMQLAHIGMEQGKRAVQSIIGLQLQDMSAIANCIYTDTEAVSIGMTEKDAKDSGCDYITAKVNMSSNARTLIATDDRSFIKIIVERSTHRIIGAQLLCKRASDIASEIVTVINNGGTVESMQATIRPHPSFSEAITDVIEIAKEKLDDM